ncbi:MAG: hypothetical protein HY089_10770 [Ignavibacteriales bacterium]|nr:hypothetical protein [Ignavibacteriales bacterium]
MSKSDNPLIPIRAKILGLIKTPLAFYALGMLVLESMLLGSLPFIQEEHRSYLVGAALGILAFLLVAVLGLQVWFKIPIHLPFETSTITPLKNRQVLYEHAAQILQKATHVLDTTWGRDPQELTPAEKTAREQYLLNQKEAIQKGAQYWDLYSTTRTQKEQIAKAVGDYVDYPNYQARLLTGISHSISMLDFLIADGEHILLSHVDASGVIDLNRFAYIRSKQLAQVLASVFHECWDEAESVK